MNPNFNPNYKSIGELFVQHYYTCYDNGRKQELANLYHDTALLTFESDQKQGKVDIMLKHMAVTCGTSHAITRTDCQPTSDGGVLVVVLGQLKGLGAKDNIMVFCVTTEGHMPGSHSRGRPRRRSDDIKEWLNMTSAETGYLAGDRQSFRIAVMKTTFKKG